MELEDSFYGDIISECLEATLITILKIEQNSNTGSDEVQLDNCNMGFVYWCKSRRKVRFYEKIRTRLVLVSDRILNNENKVTTS